MLREKLPIFQQESKVAHWLCVNMQHSPGKASFWTGGPARKCLASQGSLRAWVFISVLFLFFFHSFSYPLVQHWKPLHSYFHPSFPLWLKPNRPLDLHECFSVASESRCLGPISCPPLPCEDLFPPVPLLSTPHWCLCITSRPLPRKSHQHVPVPLGWDCHTLSSPMILTSFFLPYFSSCC